MGRPKGSKNKSAIVKNPQPAVVKPKKQKQELVVLDKNVVVEGSTYPIMTHKPLTTNEAMMMVRKLLAPDTIIFSCQPSDDPYVPLQVIYVHNGIRDLLGAITPDEARNVDIIQMFKDTLAALKEQPQSSPEVVAAKQEEDEMAAYLAQTQDAKHILETAGKVTVVLDEALDFVWLGVPYSVPAGVSEVPSPLVELIGNRNKLMGEVAARIDKVVRADNIMAQMPTRQQYPMQPGEAVA